ncbi:hydrogenase expression protein HypA [Thioclava dalianensis]|uniref:Hydrogenase expression protein HypA n=1 Tax=Thioclava dalianensis TaxID=1185766 RepID=A0A074TR02_9RHOB|nr:PqqD family protein [Thioclava dalianensis]KEP71393.1 hydrogenase expression protein HypA [Thioclava dalianensis]SFM78989.1 Coenzyme PQQ synthesis protein D (PqqD) [Thioclava dalianensis]
MLDQDIQGYRPAKDCVVCSYGDGLAVLDMRSNQYFSLDAVGAVVWEVIARAGNRDEMITAVTEAYDVTPEVCAADIAALLSELHAQNLIEPVQ